MIDSENFRGRAKTSRPTLGRVCSVQRAGKESDVAEQRGAAAAAAAAAVGLCKALPQPRSCSASMEAQSISEIHSLC